MSVEIDVRVVPRSSKEAIVLQDDRSLKVWVRAAPTDGQANAAVVGLLAKAVGVAKSNLTILRGETGRTKRIRIEGVEPSELKKRLSS